MLSKLLTSCIVAAVFPIAVQAAKRESDAPLRAVVDSSAAFRWELHWNEVALYDASTSLLVRRFPLEGAAQSSSRDFCPPDLVVSRDGVAYVTSNIQPVLWRIHPASLRVERVGLEVDVDQGKDFGFTGLGWSADGNTLYAAGSNDGATWRLDPVTSRAFKLGAAADNRDCENSR